MKAELTNTVNIHSFVIFIQVILCLVADYYPILFLFDGEFEHSMVNKFINNTLIHLVWLKYYLKGKISETQIFIHITKHTSLVHFMLYHRSTNNLLCYLNSSRENQKCKY